MNRIAKIASAAVLTLGLALFTLPAAGADGGETINGIGSTGCCKV